MGTYLKDPTLLEIGEDTNAEQLTANSSSAEIVAQILKGWMTPKAKEARGVEAVFGTEL